MNYDNLFTFIIGSLCAAGAGVMVTMHEGLPQALGPIFGAMIVAVVFIGFSLAMASSLDLRKATKALVVSFGFGLLTGALANYLGSWVYAAGLGACVYTACKIAGPRPAPRRHLRPMDPRL